MTLDGIPIELQANIELPQDVNAAIEAGATGVGLFRSEFLFLNRDDLPGEDEQFEAYRKVAEAMDETVAVLMLTEVDYRTGRANGCEIADYSRDLALVAPFRPVGQTPTEHRAR